MAGATLSSSFVSDLHRDFASGNMGDIRITIEGAEGRGFEPELPDFSCPYCDFAASSRSDLTQHQWQVHPIMAKHKRHKMTSPKGSRKRPNSESSDEGKCTNVNNVAPKKKLSPAHVPMTSRDYDVDVNPVRRTSSADAIRKMREAEVWSFV